MSLRFALCNHDPKMLLRVSDGSQEKRIAQLEHAASHVYNSSRSEKRVHSIQHFNFRN
jgi:hypothetical protein